SGIDESTQRMHIHITSVGEGANHDAVDPHRHESADIRDHDGHFVRRVHEAARSWTYEHPDTVRNVVSQRRVDKARRRGEAAGLETGAQLEPVRTTVVGGLDRIRCRYADFESRHRCSTFPDSGRGAITGWRTPVSARAADYDSPTSYAARPAPS